jgi:hypothetical protein
MKNHLTCSFLILLIGCSSPVTRNEASIRFAEIERDFGTLSFKREMEYQFEFSNPGETGLVISDVKTSCGCTAARWTKEPVKPGKSGTINIRYDAAFPGVFQKGITVHYNGPDSPVILKIKGEVNYPDEPQTENQ